ncbi:hypothetical protein ACLBXO_31200 [Methylobacterium sp. C33D]
MTVRGPGRHDPTRASTIAAALPTGTAAALLVGPALAVPAGLPTPVAAQHRRPRRSARMPAGSRFNTVTRGAIGGGSGDDAATGSTAAPSGC